jgi:hypothetical protein
LHLGIKNLKEPANEKSILPIGMTDRGNRDLIPPASVTLIADYAGQLDSATPF